MSPQLCIYVLETSVGKDSFCQKYGAVAQLVCGYLQAFGSRVIAYDPYVKDDPAPAELVELDVLLAESDVVSIHARLTEATQRMIGRDQLAMME